MRILSKIEAQIIGGGDGSTQSQTEADREQQSELQEFLDAWNREKSKELQRFVDSTDGIVTSW